MRQQNLFYLSMSSNSRSHWVLCISWTRSPHICRRINWVILPMLWQHTSTKSNLELICKSFSVNGDCKKSHTDLHISFCFYMVRQRTYSFSSGKKIGLKKCKWHLIFWIIILANLFWEIFIPSAFYQSVSVLPYPKTASLHKKPFNFVSKLVNPTHLYLKY